MAENIYRRITMMVLICFIMTGTFVFSEDIQVEGYQWRLDLPEKWELLDAEDLNRISFTDPDHQVVFQVITYPGDKFFKAKDIYETVKGQLKAEGEGDSFLFNMKNSFLAELSFSTGKVDAIGYFLFINSDDHDYCVLAFTSRDQYEKYYPFILSSLDSFALNEEGLFLPGPVSQFYYPFPGPQAETVSVPFGKDTITVELDKNEIEATQLVIEREAIVLASYQDSRMAAWERFYRVIYRDLFHRLERFYHQFELFEQKKGRSKKEMIVDLLTWIQGFQYTQSGTLSDISTPLQAMVENIGDCDSRGLLYLILLHHMGADAVILVSVKYAHSAVGISNEIMRMNGARIEIEGKDYLFAELTAKVDIGMIASDIADPGGWIPIRLGK